jgi:hypothetical protein
MDEIISIGVISKVEDIRKISSKLKMKVTHTYVEF